MQKKVNQRKVTRKSNLGILLLLTLFVISSLCINCSAGDQTVEVNTTNFPSNVFRKYISKNIDKNHDGVLSQKEMEEVKYISLWKPGKNGVRSYNEVDLKGINYFINLKELNVYAQKYKGLELLSEQVQLKDICFYSDKQKIWKFPEIKNLKKLVLDDEDIKRIDLSKNSQLEEIELVNHSNRKLKLDFRKNTRLQKINIISSSKKKAKLDFSNNNCLKKLRLNILYSKIIWPKKSSIEEIKITNQSKKDIRLNLKKNINLKELYVNNKYNSKMFFDFTKNKNLKRIYLNTKYSKIVWPEKGIIKYLYLKVRQKNQRMELKEIGRIKEIELDFANKDNVHELTISKCHNLKKVYIEGKGKLQKVNISQMNKLKEIYIYFGKKLKEIQFKNTPNVKSLRMSGRGIENVNLVSLRKIRDIVAENCGIKVLDLRGLKNLLYLKWTKGNCRKLLLGHNDKLERVDISRNKITGALDLSDMKRLWNFYCDHNKITEIYASKKLKEFNDLSCEYNNLKKLNFYNTYVERIYAKHNPTLKEVYLRDDGGADFHFDKGVKKHYKEKW